MNLLNRILNKLNRSVYLPIEILLKRREFSQDTNYKANDDIAKCFENRDDLSGDDTALLKRISSAYKKASNDLFAYPEIFHPSNEWLPIYKHNLKEVMQALEECNLSDLDKIYRNFWREPCSTGLLGLPVDMKRSFFGHNKKISYVDKSHYLNDSIYRFNLWKKLLGERYSLDSLISPLIGNPYGYFVDGKFIKAGADYQHYYATRINDLLKVKQSRKVIAEIGGALGEWLTT